MMKVANLIRYMVWPPPSPSPVPTGEGEGGGPYGEGGYIPLPD